MKENTIFIIRSFRLLFLFQPRKLLFLSLLTLFLGINQGFSIILLIPFLQLLEVGEPESSNALSNFFNTLFERSGITLSLEVVLITYAIVLTLTALLAYFKTIYQAAYQQGFTYQIRKRLFRKIILSDWTLLNSKSKYNHIQVLAEEVPKLADYYYFYLKMLTTIIILSAYLVFAFMLSAKFSIFVLLAGLLSFLILRKFLFKSYLYGSDYVSAFNRLLKYIDDFWQTVKIAKVHSSEKFYYRKFEEANSSILKLEYKLLRNHSLPQLISRIAGLLILVAVIYAGNKTGQVPLVSFFILIILFARIFPLFVSINTDLNRIVSTIASVKMVMKLDEQFEESTFRRKSDGKIDDLKHEISIENLQFAYPGGEALFTGFSAQIPAGKLTGIIGQSGSGKTTLIDLIAGLLKPLDGRILIDGVPLDEKLHPQWTNSIGYLPQDAFFIDGSLRENLVWDSDSTTSDDMIWSVLQKVNAHELVGRLEHQLDTMIVNHQYFFSGGERQRLALARILLRQPKILILDEATSSLDIENERLIMEVLKDLTDKVTILFVTHRTSVMHWCDEVIRIPGE